MKQISRIPAAVGITAALIGLIAAVHPLAAQETGDDEALWLGLSTGYINIGQLVNEPTRAARFGNTGKDLYYAVTADVRRPGRPVGITARLLVSPTHYFTWQKESPEEEISRWHWRPDTGRMASTAAVWSCLSVGARYYALEWLNATAGGALCSISGGSYLFGALPMHVPTLNIGIRALPRVSDRMRLGAECDANPTRIGTGNFSVLHEQSGEIDPESRTARWAAPLQCGFVIQVRT